MITLISYPRSGNTFLRNVLLEVYGIASKTFHLETHGADEGWEKALVVKSHLLPNQLPDSLKSRPIVYLIRDGRDATVSLAHHRKDIFSKDSEFEESLRAATYAAEGSHFGGWSTHASTWVKQADVIIRFEDLIKDPIAQAERLRPWLELPAPDHDKLPTFQNLKSGGSAYGSGKSLGKDLSQHWFRKGKVNGWKTEISEKQHDLFWHVHGEVMEVFGYSRDGEQRFELPLLSKSFREKSGLIPKEEKEATSLLIEANKLKDKHFDGIKRYVFQLLKTSSQFPLESIGVNVSVGTKEYSVQQALELEGLGHDSLEHGFLNVLKNSLKALLPSGTYNKLAQRFPLAKVQRIFRKPTVLGAEQRMEYDIALLTLPQNFEYLQNTLFKRLMVVVHDLTHQRFPQFHEANNVNRTKLGMQFTLEKNAQILAVSKSTKHDLKKAGIESSLVYEGVDRTVFYPIHNQHLKDLVRERYRLPRQKFLLSVSTLEPRKNIARLMEAYASIPNPIRNEYHLVLAGKKGWKWNEFQIPESCSKQVHFTGFVREDHLPALYTQAHGFCYVSHCEGFGLPVLEAMACACPVLVSNTSSLPELVGEIGFQCDPNETASIAHGLMQLIENGGDQGLKISSMKQSWDFTWSKCWEGFLQTIK